MVKKLSKSSLITIAVIFLLSVTGGMLAAFYHEHKLVYEIEEDFLNVPIEFTDTYLGPIENRWTKYIDNPLPLVVHHGSKTARKIALTFDDGPRPESTTAILNMLELYGIKATFFLVGSQAEKYPQLVEDIYNRGHEIGNHTFSHHHLTGLAREQVIEELEKTRTVIFNQTGFIPYLFRPPGGHFNSDILGIAKELNYTTVFWTNNSGDWQKVPQQLLVKRVIDNTYDGSIILMHNSSYSSTLEALPVIIENLKHKGFSFTTISELNKQQASPSGRIAYLETEQ